MKALLVIDAQNAIVDFKDFQEELKNIDDDETSPFYKELPSSELHPSLKEYADIVIEKKTPSAFFQTELDNKLKQLGVDHLFITGFNTEFCCQFTAIAAYDRGFKVTFIEDATGTVNDGATYGMKELDIRDFVGTVLHWSNVIEVLDQEEYAEAYKASKA